MMYCNWIQHLAYSPSPGPFEQNRLVTRAPPVSFDIHPLRTPLLYRIRLGWLTLQSGVACNPCIRRQPSPRKSASGRSIEACHVLSYDRQSGLICDLMRASCYLLRVIVSILSLLLVAGCRTIITRTRLLRITRPTYYSLRRRR